MCKRYALMCLFLVFSNLCFAESFQLEVDNQTDDLFRVQASDNAYYADLKPYETGASYTTDWIENTSGAKSFTFRFISISGLGYEVYTSGTYNGDTPKVFCKPSSTHYECQLTYYNESAAKLSILRADDPN